MTERMIEQTHESVVARFLFWLAKRYIKIRFNDTLFWEVIHDYKLAYRKK